MVGSRLKMTKQRRWLAKNASRICAFNAENLIMEDGLHANKTLLNSSKNGKKRTPTCLFAQNARLLLIKFLAATIWHALYVSISGVGYAEKNTLTIIIPMIIARAARVSNLRQW